MADCVRRGGSRRGRGLGFGRQGWLVFWGWWSVIWGLTSVLEAADEVIDEFALRKPRDCELTAKCKCEEPQ